MPEIARIVKYKWSFIFETFTGLWVFSVVENAEIWVFNGVQLRYRAVLAVFGDNICPRHP